LIELGSIPLKLCNVSPHNRYATETTKLLTTKRRYTTSYTTRDMMMAITWSD